MQSRSTTTAINTGRQEALSLARGLAIFFMICAHVLEILSTTEAQNALPAALIMLFATIPAAPLFMFAMGIFSVYSRKQGVAQAFKRGQLLLLAGYALNFVRGFLPALIGVQTGLGLEPLPVSVNKRNQCNRNVEKLRNKFYQFVEVALGLRVENFETREFA